MRRTMIASALGGAALMAAAPAAAQGMGQGMANGSEIVNQAVQVQMADGAVHTLQFGPSGSVNIVTSTGQTIPANWFVQNGTLCLQTANARECVPYNNAFQAQQAVTVTSDCGATSTWTALGTNQMQMPTQRRAGERG